MELWLWSGEESEVLCWNAPRALKTLCAGTEMAQKHFSTAIMSGGGGGRGGVAPVSVPRLETNWQLPVMLSARVAINP